jgi:16S rRNA (adenine1518-N6/adenine1519-N6)-dimethyltransferase
MPKKSLGQNFLIDKNITSKIISCVCLGPGSIVVEVGPGTGALTEKLLQTGAVVYAIEIDKRLCNILEDKFKGNNNFFLKHADILDFKLSELNLNKKATLIGNLPFNVSSQIIAKFLPQSEYLNEIFVTVQKELAIRLVSSVGTRDTGSISLFVHFYSKPKILFTIKRTCFRPVPKVDACFVSLKLKSSSKISQVDTQMLFSIIRAAFNQRRKTLYNSLKTSFDAQKLKFAFSHSGIDQIRRPETISLDEYIDLMNCLKQSD